MFVNAQGPGEFRGSTAYRDDYQRWKTAAPLRHRPPEYQPCDSPLDTVPTYRDAYVKHRAPPVKSCKPPHPGVVDSPFDATTEYRREYLKKELEHCPAEKLLLAAASGVRRPDRCDAVIDNDCYKLVERDDVGHQWYQRHHVPQALATVAA